MVGLMLLAAPSWTSSSGAAGLLRPTSRRTALAVVFFAVGLYAAAA